MPLLVLSAAAEPQPDQDISAKAFHESGAFPRCAGCGGDADTDVSRGEPGDDLLHERQALLYFTNSDPHACIDIAGGGPRNPQARPVVGRIPRRPPSPPTSC